MDLAKDDANAGGNGIKKTFRVGDRANDVEIEDRLRESECLAPLARLKILIEIGGTSTQLRFESLHRKSDTETAEIKEDADYVLTELLAIHKKRHSRGPGS